MYDFKSLEPYEGYMSGESVLHLHNKNVVEQAPK